MRMQRFSRCTAALASIFGTPLFPPRERSSSVQQEMSNNKINGIDLNAVYSRPICIVSTVPLQLKTVVLVQSLFDVIAEHSHRGTTKSYDPVCTLLLSGGVTILCEDHV